MSEKGIAVERNMATAVDWYQVAGKNSSISRHLRLGYLYHMGIGVLKDEVEAGKWYLLAAKMGDSGAQNILGSMFLDGVGVNRI